MSCWRAKAGRLGRRRTAVVLLCALLAGCTSGVGGGPETPGGDIVIDGATTISLGGGAELLIPDGAFTDGSKVHLTREAPPELPVGQNGTANPVDVAVEDGAQPKVPVELRFPYDPTRIPDTMKPGQIFGVSTYDENSETWLPLEVQFDPATKTITATSPTLSWKWPWQWDWAGIGADLNQGVGEAVGKRAPGVECPRGTAIPRWVIGDPTSNESAVALRSCAESENGALILELVNNRPYGVIVDVDVRPRWTWRQEPDDVADLIALHVLEASVVGPNQLYLAPLSRGTVALGKGQWRTATLRATATTPTIIASYAGIALGGVVVESAAKTVAGALSSACFGSFIKTNAEATVASIGDLHTVMSASASCFQQILEGRVLDRALTPDQRGRAAGAYKMLGRVGVYAALWSAEWNSLDLLLDAQVNAGMSELIVQARQPLLTADDTGLGPWRFGSPFAEVYAGMKTWFDAPDFETGWTRYHRFGRQPGWFAEQGDPISLSWGYEYVRLACWEALCAIFGGASPAAGTFLGWELSKWRRWDSYAEVDTSEPPVALAGSQIGLGDTWADFSAAYPDATLGVGEGNGIVIDNPPWPGIFDGVWAWRLEGAATNGDVSQAPPGAKIVRMSGGEGPEPGCC